MTSEPPRLMTYKGVSERLGLTVRTIQNLVKNEGLPAIRIGHSVRFDPRALEKWLADRSKQGRSKP